MTRTCLAIVACAACGSGTPAPTPPAPPPTAEDAPARADAAAPTPADVAAAPVLGDADCRALASAAAFGIARVTAATPDCSSIGNLQIVFEVMRLARGSDITTLVTSRPLYGTSAERVQEGDLFVVAITPREQPATTVFCVPLPASDGTVHHALKVASAVEGDALLDSIVAGSACPAATTP